MTTIEIGIWKSTIVQCEQSLLGVVAVDACQHEVILRNHEMTEASQALGTCLENNTDIANQAETLLSLKLLAPELRQ